MYVCMYVCIQETDVFSTLDCLHDVPINYVTTAVGSRDSHGTDTLPVLLLLQP